MIRRGTLIWLSLALVAAYAMYHLKYDVIALEEELAKRNQEILAYQESIHVLRAEWAYLNEPSRLARLAAQHLDLRPLSVTDEVEVSALMVRGAADPVTATMPLPLLKPTLAAVAATVRGE